MRLDGDGLTSTSRYGRPHQRPHSPTHVGSTLRTGCTPTSSQLFFVLAIQPATRRASRPAPATIVDTASMISMRLPMRSRAEWGFPGFPIGSCGSGLRQAHSCGLCPTRSRSSMIRQKASRNAKCGGQCEPSSDPWHHVVADAMPFQLSYLLACPPEYHRVARL